MIVVAIFIVIIVFVVIFVVAIVKRIAVSPKRLRESITVSNVIFSKVLANPSQIFSNLNFLKCLKNKSLKARQSWQKILFFFSNISRFFAHEGPVSSEKVPIYGIFSKNANRIFSNMPRADVWGLGMDSRHSALLRHFFGGGSARGMCAGFGTHFTTYR